LRAYNFVSRFDKAAEVGTKDMVIFFHSKLLLGHGINLSENWDFEQGISLAGKSYDLGGLKLAGCYKFELSF